MNDRDCDEHWRRDLKVKIGWALLAKVLALILLWSLFFRGGTS